MMGKSVKIDVFDWENCKDLNFLMVKIEFFFQWD